MPKSFLFTHKRYDDDQGDQEDKMGDIIVEGGESRSNNSNGRCSVGVEVRHSDKPKNNNGGGGFGPFQKITKRYAERYLAEQTKKKNAECSSNSISSSNSKNNNNNNSTCTAGNGRMCIRVPEVPAFTSPVGMIQQSSQQIIMESNSNNNSTIPRNGRMCWGNSKHWREFPFVVGRRVGCGLNEGTTAMEGPEEEEDEQPVNLSIKKVDLFNLNQLAEVHLTRLYINCFA